MNPSGSVGCLPGRCTLNTLMQRILPVCLVLAAVALTGAAPAPPRLLVVVTGESNSGGYALNTEATPEELAPRRAVRILDNATLTFEPLDIGTNNLLGHDGLDAAATHGVELELAKRAADLPEADLPVHLVKTGQGGSRIRQWAPDGKYFGILRTRVAAAKKLLADRPLRPVILFSLGINDAIAGTPVNQWKQDVKDHLVRLREEIGGDPPIVMTRFMPRYERYNVAIAEICSELQGVYSVETRDAPLRDENHWNYAGMRLVAGRMLDVLDRLGLFPPLAVEPPRPAGEGQPVSYTRDIKGILSNRCIRCHGPDAADRHGGGPDGLRLDTFAGATTDLDGHAAIVPGKPDASAIMARITSTDPAVAMPPPEAGPRLPPEQVELLRRWIAGGAAYEPHWAYLPPKRPAVPAVKNAGWPRNDIDRFILARLEAEGLSPQPEADRPTLARRLAIDLTGLPPTPETVDAFVADRSPDAVEKFAGALFAHDGFGEHMARQWLDLARYADSCGYAEDNPRTIWGWRDWVIRAYDTNMPFDQFTIRQLAGDLLPGGTLDDRIATAFHRNTPTNDEGGTDDEEFRTVAVIDRVNTTLSVWMGTTMACAQCHDHKYDPLSQKEYFQVYAILNNTADSDKKGDPPHAVLPAEPEDTQRAAFQREIAEIETGIPQLKQPPAKGRPEPPEFQPARRIIDDLRRKLAALPAPVTVPVLVELPAGKRRATRIQLRGNFRNLGDAVGEGLPTVFNQPPAGPGERIDRLVLAKWLVDPRNPLTARVVVNRLWERIFGIGLVSTSEEFGSQGELPSHPELLDWLATELVAREWDTKAILRLIVTSAAYRQTSKCPPDVVARDPENRLVACGPRVRLSAEVIRDQALAAAGLLSRKKGGPSVRPPQPDFGLGAAFGGAMDWKTSEGEDRYRRAIYTSWRRSNPYPSMAVFDAPARDVCTIRRPRTNTPLQALVTLNDPVYVEAAQALARRMVREGGETTADRVVRGFRLVLARRPAAAEIARLVRLHDEAAAEFAAGGEAARKMASDPLGPVPAGMDVTDLAAWTVVANVILNLDETFMCP